MDADDTEIVDEQTDQEPQTKPKMKWYRPGNIIFWVLLCSPFIWIAYKLVTYPPDPPKIIQKAWEAEQTYPMRVKFKVDRLDENLQPLPFYFSEVITYIAEGPENFVISVERRGEVQQIITVTPNGAPDNGHDAKMGMSVRYVELLLYPFSKLPPIFSPEFYGHYRMADTEEIEAGNPPLMVKLKDEPVGMYERYYFDPAISNRLIRHETGAFPRGLKTYSDFVTLDDGRTIPGRYVEAYYKGGAEKPYETMSLALLAWGDDVPDVSTVNNKN